MFLTVNGGRVFRALPPKLIPVSQSLANQELSNPSTAGRFVHFVHRSHFVPVLGHSGSTTSFTDPCGFHDVPFLPHFDIQPITFRRVRINQATYKGLLSFFVPTPGLC